MKKIMLFVLLAFFIFPAVSFAAIVKNTSLSKPLVNVAGLKFKKTVYDVTSDAAGAAALALDAIVGAVDHIYFILDSTAPPTTGWNVYLYDREATPRDDLFDGSGVGLVDTKNYNLKPKAESSAAFLPYSGTPYIVFSGMGDTKEMQIEVWSFIGTE